jgi:23S rRNA (cytosine1962-C5)-methyltransferase
MQLPIISISPRAAARIARGHLWIFANEIDMTAMPAEKGAWCRFACKGAVVATGYCNRHSLIAGRVAAVGDVGDIPALLLRRLADAFSRRLTLWKQAGSARLLFSESDLLPGLIVDAYGDILVAQSSTAGMDTVLNMLETAIPQAHEQMFGARPSAFVVRGDASVRRLEGIGEFARIVLGDEAGIIRGTLVENGVTYAGDFLHGQKTGFFLDQRDNRVFLGRLVAETGARTVLDLCCYSGGWGLRALSAGAEMVTFVDQSDDALRLAVRGLESNGVAPERARLANADVFEFLAQDAGAYDIVVADPPAFVKSQKELPKARAAYEKLNRMAWRRVRMGGHLITCSCSYHLSEPDFLEMLRRAVSRERGMAHIVYRGGQAQDHPALLSMPETAYLKCAALRKMAVA